MGSSRVVSYRLTLARSGIRPMAWCLMGVLAGCIMVSRGQSAAAPDPIFQDCPTCPSMVVVPPGQFVMGEDHYSRMRDGSLRPHGPARRIDIKRAFAVARFEVTEAEFTAFVSASGYRIESDCGLSDQELADTVGRAPAALPVVCVSWRDANAYADWLSQLTGQSYRLLTEAEWEYVALAGSTEMWPWGATAEEICRYANVLDESAMAVLQEHPVSRVPGAAANCSDGAATRSPVGRYAANAFGVYDMVGNVWEWVADCSVLPYPDRPTDGSAVLLTSEACTHRAIRGGSWRSRLERQRVTFRGRDPEDARSDIFGFRVARSVSD